MQVGQTYNIQAETYTPITETPKIMTYKAKLLQETKRFYVFEYTNNVGNKRKTIIDRIEYKRNPNLIQEV